MNGLLAVMQASGTLHSIEEPPLREGFAREEDWQLAYDNWYARVHFWRSSVGPNEEDDPETTTGGWYD